MMLMMMMIMMKDDHVYDIVQRPFDLCGRSCKHVSYVCRRLGPNLLHGENGVTASLEMAWSTGIFLQL